MDKTTLKAWFTHGKKPTAAQFAAWMDSYWHKDESLPTTAVEGLDNLLDEKAVIDDAHTSTATTYSSQRITQLLETISGSLEPEKDVIAVDTADELLEIESPSSEVLYLVTDENVLYRWDGLTFVCVEADNTVYIRNLSDLDTVTDVRDYNVVWTKQVSASPVRYAASSWSLSVSSSGSSALTQHLANRDGYYVRIASLSVTGAPSWGAWERRTYAMQADVDELQTAVRWHHAQAKRKHRTTVHYCSSRMKFAMPKVGTTVLIDDAKPHFWGFASFGRPKHGVTKAQLKANPSNASLYEGVSEITATAQNINDKTLFKYNVKTKKISLPNWPLKLATQRVYTRVKPFDNLDPRVTYEYTEDLNIVDLHNATGSTGLVSIISGDLIGFDFPQAIVPLETEFCLNITNLASPVVDLCARLTLNDLVVSTPETTDSHTAHYAIGDIVQFDGTQWQRIDRLATGRSVRVLYQKIEVERTGENAFCYRPQRITLPEFKSFQFRFTSPSQDAARHTVAAPVDVLNAYLQYVAQRGGSTAFYQDRNDRTVPRVGTLAIYTKVRTGGKKTRTHATVWHRCLPAAGFATGDRFYRNYREKGHHLLCPNTYNWYIWPKYPWYVDAYIVVVRPVAKFNRTKLGIEAQFEPIVQHKPYHRNIEISNRLPVRIAYIRKVEEDGTCTTTVRVRQFARS